MPNEGISEPRGATGTPSGAPGTGEGGGAPLRPAGVPAGEPATITGWHGRSDGRHPTETRDLYVAPNQDYADEWAGDTGAVHQVTYQAKNALVLRTPQEFKAAWEASGADQATGSFHPDTTSRFTDWARGQGYDAIELQPSMFDTDAISNPDEQQALWEMIRGTYGDPQSIILNPRDAQVQTQAASPAEGVPGDGGPTNGIYTSTDPNLPYTVITQHGPNREVRTRHFPTHEAADAYAETNNPDTDGSMVPNIDHSIGNHPNYSRGYYWPRHENRYAAVHQHGANQDGGEPYYGGPRVPHRTFDGTPPRARSTNMDKLWATGSPIRYQHKTIPADSPYHLFHAGGTRYPDGRQRATTTNAGDVAISKDEVVPVSVAPSELDGMPLYTDLTDRSNGQNWAFYGWDPAKDMVLVQDPMDGGEKWIPRRQLVARYLPGKWY